MQTSFGLLDWFSLKKPLFTAPGLGKLALFEKTPQALAIKADDKFVYLRKFHAEHEWALLNPDEARVLACHLFKAADIVEANNGGKG